MPLSKTRNRGKNHKRRQPLSLKEKHRAKVDQAVSDAYAYIPGDSVAIAIAQQNQALRNHLRNPREFYDLFETIKSDPAIGTIERYGGLLQRSGTMTQREAVMTVYTLITYRTLEHWKRIAQTYLITAPVLDEILQDDTPITCNPQDFSLPFKTFFVDLGVIDDTNSHEGVFVHQHDDNSQIDFTYVNGELITSITLGQGAHVRLPRDPAKRNLNNIDYVSFILTSLLRLMTLDCTLDLRFVDEDNFTHAHNEWRTYVVRPAQDIADYVRPTWTRDAAGVTSYHFA